MTSIGDTLRRERLRRKLEVAEIAGDLKISVRFLDAIEAGDFAKLPGGVFTKSFVRQYAAYLGLDAEELAAEVQRAVEPEPPSAEITDKHKPHVPGMPMVSGDSWRFVSEPRGGLPSWLKAGALLVVLMLACSGVYWWWERPRHPATVAEIPQSTRVQAAPVPQAPVSSPVPASAPVAQPPVSMPPVAQSSVYPPAAAGTAETTPAVAAPPQASSGIPKTPPNPNASVRVGITAEEMVWIRAVVNGKSQFQGTLQAHETRTVDGDGEVVLRLGNAGGVSLTLNGKPVVGLDLPKGQIRTVQFTSGGFQIVSAPKSDLLDRL
jgi:cytoskeleton protein RodZ